MPDFEMQKPLARRLRRKMRQNAPRSRAHVEKSRSAQSPRRLSVPSGGRAGHHGLTGLHERAQIRRGRSQLDSGTEIDLTIPAAAAYLKSANKPLDDRREWKWMKS